MSSAPASHPGSSVPGSSVEVAHAWLREAAAALGDLAPVQANGAEPSDGAAEPPDVDPWTAGADLLGGLARGDMPVGERRLRRRARALWEAHQRARDRVYAAVGAYARALRRDGALLPGAALAVHDTLGEAAARLSGRALATVQLGADQRCLEVFHAR